MSKVDGLIAGLPAEDVVRLTLAGLERIQREDEVRLRLLACLKARRAQIFRADDGARERLVADLRVLLREFPGLRLDVRRTSWGPDVELVVSGWRGAKRMAGEWSVNADYLLDRRFYPDAMPHMVGAIVDHCKLADIDVLTPYAEAERRARSRQEVPVVDERAGAGESRRP